MPDPPARPARWMIYGAISFAAMGAIAHALGPRCHWLVIALVRTLVMLASAAAMAWAKGVRLVVFDPPTLWVRSLAGSFSLVCTIYAMTRLPVADVLTLTNTAPLWIVVLTALALRRAPGAREVAGLACGLAGVILVQQPRLGGDRLAAGVALASAASTAVAMLGLHRLRGIDPRAVMAHFAGTASLVAGGWLLARRGELAAGLPDPPTIAMLIGVGLTGTVGQFFLTKAYAAGAPASVSVIGLSQVAFAMVLDAAIWGRTMTPMALLGSCLILAPTAWLMIAAGRKPGAEDEALSDRAEVPGVRPGLSD